MNSLSAEASPYLRQHADNPVDWLPWGDEALGRAKSLDRPLFISIGYASCHWCHVMAHESFEDGEVAKRLNESFVPVKVDREERPDVDAIYLEAVQALSGRGGWPLSVFATPEGRPFFGGTYFPKTARHSSPGFIDVLDAIANAWTTRRAEIDSDAHALTSAVATRLQEMERSSSRPSAITLANEATARFVELFDEEHPGIGRAPKFPQAPILELALHAERLGQRETREMVLSTLDAMASGGIYDHLGGGFCRYSVDRAWQIPHFEKMLYDQAALARLYLHAWQLSGEARYLQILEETLSYLLRDLKGSSGGIYAAEDADSEGEEGRFYLWSRAEFDEVLGDGADPAAAWYGVTEEGNFEGRNVLHRPVRGPFIRPDAIEEARARLFAARSRRQRPGLDDQVITEWNAMTASVLAEAAAATGNNVWRDAAREILDFLGGHLRRDDGRWLRSYANGHADKLAVANDYAWLVDAFTRLGEMSGDAKDFEHATETAHALVALFSAEDGGWYQTGVDAEPLVVRPRELYDGVTPAAGSIAALALARLGAITSEETFLERARATVDAAGLALERSPIAFPQLVEAALFLDIGAVEVVVVGNDDRMAVASARPYAPERVVICGVNSGSPLSEGKDKDGVYVCRKGACLAPVHAPSSVDAAIAAAATEALEGAR
ncbi:MAG: thioredoxin domain-containing protein [Acidimicrobiales bacterium]